MVNVVSRVRWISSYRDDYGSCGRYGETEIVNRATRDSLGGVVAVWDARFGEYVGLVH